MTRTAATGERFLKVLLRIPPLAQDLHEKMQSHEDTDAMLHWFQNVARPSWLILLAGVVLGALAGGTAGWLLSS